LQQEKKRQSCLNSRRTEARNTFKGKKIKNAALKAREQKHRVPR
jgi:hypothetical protein